MKSMNDIIAQLEVFEKQFGLSVLQAQQGSAVWLQMKLGVLSASNASKIVAKKDSETRLSYMCELVAQVCTGVMEEINSKYLAWGSEHEGAARALYELRENQKMQPVCFVYKDGQFREGCSPDGLLSDRPAEIKTPYNASHYVKFLCEDRIKPEYNWQCQYSMRVLDADRYDFVQYHPLMKKKPIKVLVIERDAEMQKKLEDMAPEFIFDMDKMLNQIGVKFGEQWSRLAS